MSTGEGSKSLLSSRMLVWVLLAIAGSLLWVVFVTGADSDRAWRSLLINFLFFTSLAGGLVVWPAVVRTCNGRWAGGLERLGAAGIAFALPSLAALTLLWVGSPRWSPWYNVRHHQGLWLGNSFVFGRDLAALALFWGVAARYLKGRGRRNDGVWGPVLILVYSLVFSLLGFDLVMALDPKWYSTLAGGYFFISGLYIAIAGWALLAAMRPDARPEQLQDLGRLVVAFSLMTTYMMYAHLLPIWYENLPEEIRFLVPRMKFPSWTAVSYLLLAIVYFGPLVLLLMERAKRNRWALGIICLIVLAGMWVERWWLVAPTFEGDVRFGLVELSLAAAFAGVLAIGMEEFDRRAPSGFMREEQKE